MMKLTSNDPFWLIKNGLIESYPSLRQDVKTDILIIGGGITGALMAHKCLEEGYQTTLMDRREIATGSTSATTSMLQYEIDVPLFKLSGTIGQRAAEANYWACSDSIDELGRIIKKVKSNCGFEKKESLYFATNRKDVPDLKKEYQARKNCGLPVKWLSTGEIARRYKLQTSHGGILSAQGASMDAFKFTHDLLDYNHQKGLKIFDRTGVKSTEYKRDKVHLITEYGNSVVAKKVIYCSGYESTELIKDDFVKLLSTYAIVGERNQDDQTDLSGTLFWSTADPYIYMRTTDDNRILIGGEDEDFLDAKRRDELLNEKRLKLEKELKKMFPLYKFRTDYVWAGTFGETKDGLPYIGEHPNVKNSYFLLGFGGNGITFSVIGKNVIADLLKNKRNALAQYYRFKR